MKRIKISFLATLAVLVIGLTAATKVDVLKKPTSTYTCRANTDFWKGEFKRISDGVDIGLKFNDLLDFARENDLPETTCPEQGFYCAKPLTLAKPTSSFECTSGTSEFCCAKIITESQAPCGNNEPPPGYDFTSYTQKVEIYCKTAESAQGL